MNVKFAGQKSLPRWNQSEWPAMRQRSMKEKLKLPALGPEKLAFDPGGEQARQQADEQRRAPGAGDRFSRTSCPVATTA